MNVEISDREIACFEAGIKLGALYHQFVGMPISPDMVEDVERVIEKSVSNQPFVEKIKVKIDKSKVEKSLNIFNYCELKGELIEVELTVKYGEYRAVAVLKYSEERKYPLMSLKKVEPLS